MYGFVEKSIVTLRDKIKNIKYPIREYDVVHFIAGEKFTAGYISFLKEKFSDYKQLFVTTESKYMDTYNTFDDVIIIKRFNEVLVNKTFLTILEKAGKLVYSGVFDETSVAVMPDWLVRKTYFQFWGADFYRYREPVNGFKKRWRYKKFIEKCEEAAGLVFLIYGEEEVFKTILPVNNNRVFIAPVPHKSNLFTMLSNYKKKDSVRRILIGNSATKTNRHIEVFNMLEYLNNSDVEIYCPLSYGEQEYKDEVVECGEALFGSMFKKLDQYMPLEEYFSFLASVDVGVFNNNRQQATANIEYLLTMGKKVYLDPRTSMFMHYKKIGCKVYDINMLKQSSIKDIFSFDNEYKVNNRKAILAFNSDENVIKQWTRIYEDILV